MSHDLDINDGIASFADSRTDAWHQLGQQVGHLMTAEEVIREANMADWNVRKEQIYINGADGYPLIVPEKYATVRTNPVTGSTDPLGVVGERYHVFQNEDSADFLNALVDESGARFETAGALAGGRQTFVTMSIPDYMEFSGTGGVKDVTDLYVSVLNSHDGSTAFTAIVTPVRIVCKNTQTAALSRAKSRWAVRHTLKGLDMIAEARASLGMTFKYADAFAEEMNKLIDREMELDEAKRLLDSVFKVDTADTERQKNVRTEHVSNTLAGLSLKTVIGFENTRYGLYNAVTEYIDHRMETTGGNFGAPASSTVIFGNALEMKQRAFQLISA